ncbi:CDP-alcohol phosphatidyltransferase family protein [Candidatus Woesearchaeota archaeon]|nr:CDP-alcohol phosphatidyltransferase family protein [Candidatus Woesearchaeota archaeon]
MRKVESIKELRKICEKEFEKKHKQSLSKKILRFLSIYITKLLLYTSVTANQVTWFYTILGVIASILFFPGTYAMSLIGAILLHFWYLIDHVDGEIARYRKCLSHKGYFLDYMSLQITHPLTFICMTFGVYKSYPYLLTLVAGFAITFSIMFFYSIDNTRYSFFISMKKGKITRESQKINTSKLKKSLFYKIMMLIQKIGAKIWFLFAFDRAICIIFVAALINQLHLIFFFYAIVYPILIIFTVIYYYFFGIDNFLKEMNEKFG